MKVTGFYFDYPTRDLLKKPLDVYSNKFNKLPYRKYDQPLNVSEEVDSQVQA